MSAPVTVTHADTLEGLEARAAAWDDLAARASTAGGLTATHAWFAAHVEHRSPPNRSWGCLFASVGDRLVGVLPYVRRPHALLRGARPWLDVPGDEHASGGGALLDPACAAEALDALLEAAWTRAPRALGVRMAGLVSAAPALGLLRDRAGVVLADEGLAGRHVPVDGSWSDFHAGLGANHRRNLRKATNRLRRTGALAFDVVEPGADGDAGLARYLALEAEGWKGRDGGAVDLRPEARAFYASFCRRLAARGRLQWRFLTLDGATVAGLMAVRWGRQIVVQRIAYAESVARLSPGHVLLADALEAWFAEGHATRVDCLTDQPWHATWRMQREIYTVAHVVAPGVLARVAGLWPAQAYVRLRGIDLLRGAVRRLRGEAPA